MKYVDIEITVDDKKHFEAKVVGRSKNSSCLTQKDDEIIQNLLNNEIGGFGKIGKVEDYGHTEEYWREKQNETVKNDELAKQQEKSKVVKPIISPSWDYYEGPAATPF